MSKGDIINLLHILIIAPIFYALGTNKYPKKYLKYLKYVAIALILYHSYKLYIKHY